MRNTLIRNILLFLGLTFLQVMIFDNLRLGNFIHPYVYVLFVMLLPFDTEKPASMTLRVRNTGAMLPGPNGANCFKMRTNFGVMVGKSISMSTLSSGVRSPSSRCSETYFSNLSENSCRCSGFSESPPQKPHHGRMP